MHRFLKLVALLSLSALAAGAHAVPVRAAADVTSDVKSADNSVYEAIATRDVARLGDLLDEGFTLTNTFGAVYDKKGFLDACCAGPSTSRNVELSASDAQVRAYGNSAVVIAKTEMKFMRDNQNQQLAWRSIRVYVKSGAKWKLVAEQRTSIG